MSIPSVTIITVVYNCAESLEDTILSVINFAPSGFQYVIIDGGSTDGTKDIICKYANHLYFWCSEQDGGIYDAMNKGLKYCSGQYVCFINGGDRLISFPDVSLLENFDVIACSVKFVEGGFMRPSVRGLIFKNYLHHQGLVYRTHLFDEIGLYDTRYKISADYDLNLRAYMNNCKFGIADSVMALVDLKGVSSKGKFLSYYEEILIRFRNINVLIAFVLVPYTFFRFLYKKILGLF